MIDYKYEPENSRVAAYAEDGNMAGELTYIEEDGVWLANHTFVDPAHRGKQVAGKMLDIFVQQARDANIKVKPLCSYVVHSMVGKEEFADLLA